MTPQELRNSILQLAIQGKLVEQRPEEGTAEELYREIQREKARLIKEGKIKKEKPLPEITEEEKPFEIPEGWMWVHMADCMSNRAGLAYKKENLSIESSHMVRVLRGGNIGEMGYSFKNDDVMIASEFVNPDLFLKENMLITPAVSSLEHIGKMGRIERDLPSTVVGGFVLMLSPHLFEEIFSKYLLFSMSSKFFRDSCRNIVNKSGQAFYNLSREKMMCLIIPLPPLAEQKRIVAKIEELLPYIDRYEQAWNRLEAFNKRFPDEMKKSILQLAIQGKLVEQRPEEGTAEELYQAIQAEKTRLIKEGKIKKEKPLPEITEDEKPFEIPEGWKWVRTGECGSWGAGATPSRTNPNYYGGNIPWLKTGDLNDGNINKIPEFITEKALKETSVRLNPVGSVLMAMYGATIGKLGILEIESTTNQACCACIPYNGVFNKYLFYFLMAFRRSFIKMGEGGAQPNISREKIVLTLFPLPPLAEQKRIADKLDELLPICDKLK